MSFYLLDKKIQQFIAKKKWSNFRPIQDEAIKILLENRKNLLICAPTASGKTEAAFLPIVSSFSDNFSDSIKAIYISPLKALINDQFRRINEICDEIGIPVTKWHGDANQTLKSKLVKDPRGILLITPESLEAIMLNRPQFVKSMFAGLEWIVIDEIHSFVGVERGAQLRSLISRIKSETKKEPNIVGLSATVGNPSEVAQWMSPFETHIIEDKDWDDSGLEGIIHGFCYKRSDDGEELPALGMNESILSSFSVGKNLIFGNSKANLELTTDSLDRLATAQRSPASFLIHHGSLSKATRERAEDDIRNSIKPLSLLCTSTLEMGMDIGSIEKVGLLEPPWSVSSFAQRVGRSGRREGQNKQFEFFIKHEELKAEMRTSEEFREDLVKSIAIVLLYLEDFKEPLNSSKNSFSTLAHQILSLSVQKGGCSIEDAYSIVVEEGFRAIIDREKYDYLIKHLIENKILFVDGANIISVGTLGEQLVEHYEFYSVFQPSDEWAVIYNSDLVGQVPMTIPYKEGDRLILSAKRWDVVEVNERGKRLIVVPGKKLMPPVFSSSYGFTHEKIHQKMLQIYSSEASYPFLDPMASLLLEEARRAYNDNSKKTLIDVFEGSVIQNTISLALRKCNIQFSLSECFFKIEDDSWVSKLRTILSDPDCSRVLLSSLSPRAKFIEKYDEFLPLDFLDSTYLNERINVEGALLWLNNIEIHADTRKKTLLIP